jgi:hypothetical protein
LCWQQSSQPTPDILTLVAMALPMCLLYESCIWIAWLMERRASKRDRQLIACSIRPRIFCSVAFAFVFGAAVGSFSKRLHLPLAGRSLHQPAASLVLSAVQTTDSMASQSSIDQLARAWRPLRTLQAQKFSFRYFAVELVTALLFLAIWQRFPWQMAIAYWIFVSFLIIGTFIDFEHFYYSGPRNNRRNNRGRAAALFVPALNADRFARGSRCSRRARRGARLRDSLDRP